MEFVNLILGKSNAIFDSYIGLSSLELGRQLEAGTGSKWYEHDIRTLTFSGKVNTEDKFDFWGLREVDNLPDLLYDFTTREFVKLVYVDVEKQDWNTDENTATRVIEVKKNGGWIAFFVPFSSNKFMKLQGITKGLGKEEICLKNYFELNDKIVVIADPETTYSFVFERDESVTVTEANIVTCQDYVTQTTSLLNFEMAEDAGVFDVGTTADFS